MRRFFVFAVFLLCATGLRAQQAPFPGQPAGVNGSVQCNGNGVFALCPDITDLGSTVTVTGALAATGGGTFSGTYTFNNGLTVAGGRLAANLGIDALVSISSPQFFSINGPAPGTGLLRLASVDTVCWRNNGNSADLCLSKNASDNLLWPNNFSIGGTLVSGSGGGTATLPNNSGTVSELNLAQTWTANQTLNNSSQLLFLSTNGTNFAGFQGGASTVNLVWKLPSTDSTGTQCISSNGSQQLAFSACSGGTGTPGGSNTHVQYNNTGTFAGSADLEWNNGAATLTIGNGGGAVGILKLENGIIGQSVNLQVLGTTSGTYNFNIPAAAGSAGQPLLSGGGGSNVQTYGTLGYGGGGTGGTSFSSNQLVTSGASAMSSLAGTTTGTNPILKLQPSSASNTALTLDTASTPTADILDVNVNTVKTSWFDSAAILHTPQTTYTGSGALTLSGNEGTCPAPATGQDIICLGDSAAHVGKISNNGTTFKGLADWINDNPAGHGVALVGAIFPQINFTSPGASGLPLVGQGATSDPIFTGLGVAGGGTGDTTLTAHGVLLGEGTSPVAASAAGTSGQAFVSGGASADGAYGALNLAGGSSIVTGVLPVGNGGTGASSLASANIVTVSGAFTPGNCVKSSATTVAVDAGAPCGSGGSVALSGITNATGANTISNGANPQTWNCTVTGSTTCLKFGETLAATGTNNIIFQVTTLSGSTALPFQVDNNGNGVKLSSTGLLTKVGTGAIDSSALNASVCPGNGCPTLDTILTPLNSVTFQFPATDQLAITGTQPASASAGVNGATLFSVTTANGGNGSVTTGGNAGSIVYNMGNGGTATLGIGGNGGDFIVNNGTGGTSTSGIRARSGSVSINCGADGSGGTGFGTGQGEAGCLQIAVTANQGSVTFPMGLGVAGSTGIWARNTASTSNNTVNNWSPVAGGMSAHMVLSGTASVTNGSPNVAQSTGAFFGMTLPGRTITIHGVNYTILSITNNFNLVLTTNYTTDAGTTTQTFLEDAVVTGGMVLYSGTPGQSGMSQPVVANPDISWIFEIPSLNNYTGTYHWVFEEGGAGIDTVPGGGSIGGAAAFYSNGGPNVYGNSLNGNNPGGTFIALQTYTSSTSARLNVNFIPSFLAGGSNSNYLSPSIAGMGDDNKSNGTWFDSKFMANGSGGTIADGILVKMSGTADKVTPFTTTDTATPIVGVMNPSPADVTCANNASCPVSWGGVENGILTTDNASTIGDVLIPSNVNGGNLLSVTMPAPLPGSVVGISQKTVAAAAKVDLSLQPSIGGPPYMSMLTGGYTNATTTASNITGLSFPVLANFTYSAHCDLYYQGSSSTAGLDITVTGPASPTSVFYSYDESPTATSIQDSVASAFATKLTGNATVTATTNLHAVVTIGLRNGANAGTVQVQGSATGTGTVTVQNGSHCEAWAK